MNLETDIVKDMKRLEAALPSASGNLDSVRRRGRRDLFATRVLSIAVVGIVIAAGAIGLTGMDRNVSSPVIVADLHVFDGGFALSPLEEASHLTACLQQKGLDVIQEGTGISFDNTIVDEAEFEVGIDQCQAELRSAGYLLPGDNPDNIEIAYRQFQVLAECYEGAGISISTPPGLQEFIAARQAGGSGWSPQSEAISQVGQDATAAAEQACHIPTPGELSG